MKVGIVGYTGFVGSAFCNAFSQGNGYDVVGIGRQEYAKLAGSHFDILINANGNSSKRLADAEPAKDFEMNAAATLGMLKDFPCRHYIHLSTVEVYNDKSAPEAAREDAKIDPGALSNYGFSKYCGELVAKKYAKSWLILRLAGMVGPGMKKGPAHDIVTLRKLFVSPKSRLHFMGTASVARIAMELADRGRWGETYNVAGRGNISLGEFAEMAGVRLSETGQHADFLDVSTGKLENELHVPSTKDEVLAFLKDFKAAQG